MFCEECNLNYIEKMNPKLLDHGQEITNVENIMNIQNRFMRISTHHKTDIRKNYVCDFFWQTKPLYKYTKQRRGNIYER